ncbi:MAG TPA: tetratricopeptide repeat protein [Polyangiaceae bacterium]|nr:tetratricopeptide repeat protein [Polyangiaceae bacterium]
MNKRLAMLEKMTAASVADPFAFYALALEYRKEGRVQDALKTFETLRSHHPEYLPMYLMAGQMLVSESRNAEARQWLESGIALAHQKGDTKTLGELQSELANA